MPHAAFVPLVELSMARIIRHGHPDEYPCIYQGKWLQDEDIRMDVHTLQIHSDIRADVRFESPLFADSSTRVGFAFATKGGSQT